MTTSIDDATLDAISVKRAISPKVYDPAVAATISKIDSEAYDTTWDTISAFASTRDSADGPTWYLTMDAVAAANREANR